MASKSSSPAKAAPSASPTQFELTPRSKVKALLASLDNNSDEENDTSLARARLVSAFMKSTSKEIPSNSNTEPLQKSSGHTSAGKSQDQSTYDEEEDVVRPKGRLAARMLGKETDSEVGSHRPRKSSPKRTTRTATTKHSLSGSPPETSDESGAPVSSRKRKLRGPRASTPQQNPRNHSSSPGLFISPVLCRSATPTENASDSDEFPTNPLVNDRFKALVERKREERLAKEKEAAAEKAKNLAGQNRQNTMLDEDHDISDDDVERRLTQQAKPTRKASKRALEEISRETQRMSRNMQLTHKAITKKKITKASLFARFNYKAANPPDEEPPRPTSSSSATPHSDIEMRETPPTSPASHHSDLEKLALSVDGPMVAEVGQKIEDEDAPDLQDALSRLASPPPNILDKGKGKAVEEPLLEHPTAPLFRQRPIRVRPRKVTDKRISALDSDSDLEIVNAKTTDAKATKLDAIFDRVPIKKAQESSSLYALRMLAHLTSPGKQDLQKDKKSSMTTSELQISLQQRARQQAVLEREERLQALRNKGIVVQTAEEREKEMAEVEDLLSKARREGEEIMKREKAASRKERKTNGGVDSLGDSSDDEDWREEKEDVAEESSGSEEDEGSENDAGDEENGEDEEDDEDGEDEDAFEEDEIGLDDAETAKAATSNPMFDDEANETDDDETDANLSKEEQVEVEDRAEDEDEELPAQQRRRARKTNVISDDEEEHEQIKETPSTLRTKSPNQLCIDSPGVPNSVLRSATKTFIPGLSVVGPVGLGLTQIFAGTMDESQMDTSPTAPNSEPSEEDHDNAMEFLRRRPVPELPGFVPTMSNDTQEVVMDSQSGFRNISGSQNNDSQTQPIRLDFSQSQIHGFDSLAHYPVATQFSEMPDATQDVGFQHMTPIRGRFEAPPSTVDTVVLGPARASEPFEEIPIVKKKGKLRQRAPQVAALTEDVDAVELDEAETEDLDINTNMFDVMRKASKRRVIVDEFDKKNSGAKDMVHEQADESEDEYAGLGGASDDESGGEEDAYVKEIIDDEGGKDVDEHKLAAFFADRERANDEKQVEKLYNDITKGMLRRKRGADYTLSDSDDDGEARRRMKRKEFAKMRKALLADEGVGKIAENPKRQAFLRAIEDRESDDEMGFLDDLPDDENMDSQSQSQTPTEELRVPDSQPEIMGPPKRKHAEAIEAEQRLPPHLRRTKATQKPSNLSEIRDSLSSLIEEPNTLLAASLSGSESEDEVEVEGVPKGKENRDPFALRRTNVATIDRIALKRASSSSFSASTRLAFSAPSSAPGFKVPPLLRRATTNNSITSASSSISSVTGGVSGMERMAGESGDGAIKRGGGKNSGVHYFAREAERKAAIRKTEKRYKQKLSKGAEGRRKVIGGLFGGGTFE